MGKEGQKSKTQQALISHTRSVLSRHINRPCVPSASLCLPVRKVGPGASWGHPFYGHVASPFLLLTTCEQYSEIRHHVASTYSPPGTLSHLLVVHGESKRELSADCVHGTTSTSRAGRFIHSAAQPCA